MIDISLIKKLRETTGISMMGCKKALEESQNNFEEALTIVRKSEYTRVVKKIDRVTREGIIAIKVSDDYKKAIMIEINCETDFAAKDKLLLEFASIIASDGINRQINDLESFINLPSVIEKREVLVAKIGENVTIRRIKTIVIDGKNVIGSYLHSNRIGVLVELSTNNFDFARDLAIHIAAYNPIVVLPENLPQELINKEKEIYFAQLQNSGKPEDVLKITNDKIKKFIDESVLIKQPFIKNPEFLIEDLLQQTHSKIIDFSRFEVGEGIEKKMANFASEVEAQIKTK
ncbi:MAG: translation elongation factor Ts [Coxiellaceae bacterium]|jgi:elongation factor Ts|nr:translation elongation factor Ts [Coxiellaceae bacterium]